MTAWEIQAVEFANCNCDYGCPCQFNALPTHGTCEAAVGFQIEKGHHGDVNLDGLRMAAVYKWPGPVHEGNGVMQVIIDEAASDAQRASLTTILTGGDTDDMATVWWVYSAMSPTKLETLSKPIEFDVDVDARRARISVPGVFETTGEPIKNPVTGNEHRARIDLPHGFEYELAEIGSGNTKAVGEIKLDLENSYGQFANIHLSNKGVVRKRAA